MGAGAASIGSAVVGLGIGELQRKRERDALGDARDEARAGREDLGQRREATYRHNREGLQGAIDQYYQARGWKVPERLPGAFTTRALPGEGALYPEKGRAAARVESDGEDTSGQDTPSQQSTKEVEQTPVVRGAAPIEVVGVDEEGRPTSALDNARFMSQPLIYDRGNARQIALRIK